MTIKEFFDEIDDHSDGRGYKWMTTHCQGVLDDRILRLFACFCARQNWELLRPVYQNTVEVAERFANGEATDAELLEAHTEACAKSWEGVSHVFGLEGTPNVFAEYAACLSATESAMRAAKSSAKYSMQASVV